jgi:hypothetical protein
MLVAVEHEAAEVVMDDEVGRIADPDPGTPNVDAAPRAEAEQPEDVKEAAVLAFGGLNTSKRTSGSAGKSPGRARIDLYCMMSCICCKRIAVSAGGM